MNMEVVGNLIQVVGSLITLVVLPILLLNSQRRKARAEAEEKEADNITAYASEWKELYEKKERRVNELDTKIDQLYIDINRYREHITACEARISELTLKNQALEFRKCNRHGCADREPPSEF